MLSERRNTRNLCDREKLKANWIFRVGGMGLLYLQTGQTRAGHVIRDCKGGENHVNSIIMHKLTCWKIQSTLPAPKNRPLATLDTDTPTRANLHPSLSNSLRRLLSTSSSCTSSIVGSLQPSPSPLSPGNGSQPSGASPWPFRNRFSNASFSFCSSY